MTVISSYTVRGASLQGRHMLGEQKECRSSSAMMSCLNIEKAWKTVEHISFCFKVEYTFKPGIQMFSSTRSLLLLLDNAFQHNIFLGH